MAERDYLAATRERVVVFDGGMGATILPALVVQRLDARRRAAQVRPLSGPTPVREIGLVVARTELRRRVVEALAGTLRPELEAALGEAPRPYPAGTAGPAAATALIERDGRTWYEETLP